MEYFELSLFELGYWLLKILFWIDLGSVVVGVLALPPFFLLMFALEGVLRLLQNTGLSLIKFVLLMLRSLRRNLLRTSLTYLAIFVLVAVVGSIWSVLAFLDAVTAERANDFKAIITEKYQIPSQMKPSHVNDLKDLIAQLPADMRPKNGDDDLMTWSFVGGYTDPQNKTFESLIFFFVMEPGKFTKMMDGLDELTADQRAKLDAAIAVMEQDKQAVAIGKERLKLLKKQVGDVIEVTSMNYKDLVFRCKIIAELPEGRYDQSSVMNLAYLKSALDDYKAKNGQEHPLAEKSLNLIWLRLPTREAFERLADMINASGKFSPAIKMEMASSGIASFLEPYRDLIWGMRWLLSPAILITMALVISNAISISVRERRTEMAVLKVLGFRPWQVMAMVLGEALLIGVLSGFMSTGLLYFGVNKMVGGLPLPIAFFPKFFIPANALWWGPTIGALTALLGSIVPAWSARSVKASEVFAKVA